MDEVRGIYGNIRVFDVQVEGGLVSVDVYGGPQAVVCNLSFDIPDLGRRADAIVALAAWQSSDTPLVYIEGENGFGRLVEMPA